MSRRHRVRLTDQERSGLTGALSNALKNRPGTVVRLFGSRAKAGFGGDIDLLVSLARPEKNALLLKLRLKQAIEDALGERKVDIVIEEPGARASALYPLAKEEGIILWRHPLKNSRQPI